MKATNVLDVVAVEQIGSWGAQFKMSDWEEEYEGKDAAAQKPLNSPVTESKLARYNCQGENACMGVRKGGRFGAPWKGGEGRPFAPTPRRRTLGEERSDSSPVVITVESALIGRLVGGFVKAMISILHC